MRVIRNTAVIIIGVGLAAILYGALPGLAIPTLGQALWVAGFGQSFANDSWLAIHATNFGAPQPAAIAFGLVGAWLTGLFINLGLHPADAYALMCVAVLGAAFLAAYGLCRHFGVSFFAAFLASLLWLSMPIIWGNAGFSMLSLGFALMPLYLAVSLKLFILPASVSGEFLLTILVYAGVVLIAVFTDGYSFLMFALLSTAVGAYAALSGRGRTAQVLYLKAPVHFLSFLIAYIAYTTYVGTTDFGTDSLEYFRGGGLDLAYVVIPSSGQHWLLDQIGASVQRTTGTHFGHFASWTTTFSLPILLAGFVGWICMRKSAGLATPVMLVLLFSFYMALGPSLKVDSRRIEQDTIQTGIPEPGMPAERAIMPTGNAWIYEHAPGFKQMRSPYRWIALTVFCAWFLFILQIGSTKSSRTAFALIALFLLIAFNLPDVGEQVDRAKMRREMFLSIDEDLVRTLGNYVEPGELIAFLPYRNGWMINYVAARSGIRSFNIGGDKNLIMARQFWPGSLRRLKEGEISVSDVEAVLSEDTVDAVVLAYFNSLTSSFNWPCAPPFECPGYYRAAYADIVASLDSSGAYSVADHDLFAVIRRVP